MSVPYYLLYSMIVTKSLYRTALPFSVLNNKPYFALKRERRGTAREVDFFSCVGWGEVGREKASE
jgi:hypothetical protein